MTTPTPFIDPPKPPLWRRTWVRITAAAFLAFAIGGALASPDEAPVETVAASTEEEPTTTEAPTTTTTEEPTTTTEAPTTTADPLAGMEAWTTRALPLVEEIGSAFSSITAGAEVADFAAVESACADLLDIVEEAERETLPAPLPNLDRPWRAALTAYSEGAQLCIAGAGSYDPDLVMEAAERFSSGVAHIEEATAILTDLTS